MSETASKTFDPSECIRGIQQLLVSDKKKIAFLFGAGTSLAKRYEDVPNIPAIGKMTELVEIELRKIPQYASALVEIKAELKSALLNYNIETLLSNVEDKIRIIGDGKLNNLNKVELQDMDKMIRENIRKIVSIHTDFSVGMEIRLVQYDFAKWICNADRRFAVEIFTTNYDYLFEIGLESMDVPYYDGFTGSYKPFFNSDSLEDLNYLPQQTKLWKIHGSLGLHEDSNTKRIIRMNSDSTDLLIYPSALKYNNSKKQPYAAFMDRLNAFLKQDDTVLFVCGYSFADDHINERILSALNTNSSSHVFVLYYDILWNEGKKEYTFTQDSVLAKIAMKNRKISVLATRSAVIGSTYGKWKLKREPDKEDTLNVSLYFDEDAPVNVKLALKEEHQDDEVWTGEGELILPDFVRFTDFLKYMIPKNEWEEETDE